MSLEMHGLFILEATDTMAKHNSGAHILVFPYPAPGHMMPLIDLTHHLASRGLNITVVVTPKNLPFLDRLLSAHPAVETLVLPFPADGSLPDGVENVKDLPPSAFPIVLRAMRHLHVPILRWFRDHDSPPVAILSDMFLWWTNHLAQQLNVHRFMFSPSGVMAMSVIYSLRRYPPENDDSGDPNRLISPFKLPNSLIYPQWQLQFLYRTSYEEGDPISEFMKDGIFANMASSGLVFNSFNELERTYIDLVMEEAGHDRVWTVGPLLLREDDSLGPSSNSDDIFRWLDACGDGKVVYVCFGSQIVLNNDQMEAIAAALEKSGAKFLWCVKEGVGGGGGVVPSGFEDRTAGIGLVVRGWVPQVRILRHWAVVAFLTHCGWNSVLEGLATGVQMLAWPMEAEQFLNATLLVDEMKVGVRVCEGADTVPDSDELGQAVEATMAEPAFEKTKARENLWRAALNATREGGSSYEDLDRLVLHLSQQNTS